MKILIIGEAPGPAGAGPPLDGAIGARIAEYAGVTVDEYRAMTYRANLLAAWPGDAWPAAVAQASAEAMLHLMMEQRTILLGQRVAVAFGLRLAPLMTWRPLVDDHPAYGEVAILPHPSGLNRWWNDPENRAAARRFLRDAFGGAP